MKALLFTKLQELFPSATSRYDGLTEVPNQFDELGLIESWVDRNGEYFAACEMEFENNIKFRLLENAPELVPVWKQYLDFRACYRQRLAAATRKLADAIQDVTGYKAASGNLDMKQICQHIIDSEISDDDLMNIINTQFSYADDCIITTILGNIKYLPVM